MPETRNNASSKLSMSWARRIGTLAVIGALVAGSFASFDAEARRMGGGRSFGKQSSVASQRSTTPPPAQPSPTNPAQQAGAHARRRTGAQPLARSYRRSRSRSRYRGAAVALRPR